MAKHLFILNSSNWLGEGKIQLSMVDEQLHFMTKWQTNQQPNRSQIECIQEIQIRGLTDVMHNQFYIYDVTAKDFTIELENMAVGKVVGKGLITDKIIAWEFRVEELGFEGFEFYEKMADDSYQMRAEYASSDQYRTTIHGKIWQQAKQ